MKKKNSKKFINKHPEKLDKNEIRTLVDDYLKNGGTIDKSPYNGFNVGDYAYGYYSRDQHLCVDANLMMW